MKRKIIAKVGNRKTLIDSFGIKNIPKDYTEKELQAILPSYRRMSLYGERDIWVNFKLFPNCNVELIFKNKKEYEKYKTVFKAIDKLRNNA